MKSTNQNYSLQETRILTNSAGLTHNPKSKGIIFRRSLITRKILSALCLLSITVIVSAQERDGDLTAKSLEDLMNIEVTSVSKKEEKLFQTAAAIYVITQEDIRRSGMTSLPELLRLVPGLSVARIDGSKYAISARGFNSRFTNKLLVLMDGRSVYSPEHSGVYWEAQDVLLEDIERIEVIRGPGGTLWGANAVNGVINIITKRAQDTQGGLVTVGGGSEDQGFGGIRYGSKIGNGAYYRIYTKYYNRDGLVNESGLDAKDGQDAIQGGGRLDWQLSDSDSLTLQGDIYDTRLRETPTPVSPAVPFAPHLNRRGEFTGGNVLGRWNHVFSDRSDLALQLYFDRSVRQVYDLGERIDTFDLDFQHHFAIGQRQDIVWGVGYRAVSDLTNSNIGNPVQFDPKGRTVHLFSAFAQDEVKIIQNRLRLTLGTKLEHNDYTSIEVQPSIRLLWTPVDRQTLWGVVSRAVRTPARSNTGIRVNASAFPGPDYTPNIVALIGNPDFRSEELLAYEIGYRLQLGSNVSLDIATFYNLYDHLQTLEPGRPFFESAPLPPRVVIPLLFDNLMSGETYGLEVSANWNAASRWKLSGSYSFLRMDLHPYAESLDSTSETAEGDSPRHQFQIRSYINLPYNLELDTSLYRVSRLVSQQVPGYTRLDARFGWRVGEGVLLSLGLQNLLDKRHPEIEGFDKAVITSQVQRSIYGKLTWRF